MRVTFSSSSKRKKKNNNNKQQNNNKQIIEKKNHGEMNIKRNTNILDIYILSKDKKTNEFTSYNATQEEEKITICNEI